MSVRLRTIARAAVIAASVGALAAPGSVAANPLLSGYGGPGQGTQVILGGTLLNTPGGGSGPSQGSVAASELTLSTPSTAAQPHRAAGRSGHRPATPTRTSKASPAPSPIPAKVPAAGLQPAASSGSGGTLGLSGGQILLILCSLAALTVTGVLTRQLTR